MELSLLINKIKRDKGLDLSGYKESTLTRRIERRMQFDGAGSLEEYIRMIDRDYRLYWRLVSDFFIGVTDFFRDKEIWEVVRGKILPGIVACRTLDVGSNNNTSYVLHPTSHVTQNTLRVWSAGCSTGEETYSLAIAVKEALREKGIEDLPVFIYGTDIMEDKLDIARIGEYTAEKVEKVEEGLREKFFERIADSVERIGGKKLSAKRYTLNANTKRLTRFRKYDLTKPETLAGFDMIACRNVLIYFQRGLQEKVIKHFYKTLRPGGLLWLGKGETLWDETKELFEPIFKQERIFRKRE